MNQTKQNQANKEINWDPWIYDHTGLIKINKGKFRLPVQVNKKTRDYKLSSASIVNVCSKSDYFIPQADIWRIDTWKFIHERSDCLFNIITTITETISQSLPYNWLNGWDNVAISIKQYREDHIIEQAKILNNIPIKHRGLIISYINEPLNIRDILKNNLIERVEVDGSDIQFNQRSIKPMQLKNIIDISEQCKECKTEFIFKCTGSKLQVPSGDVITISSIKDQEELAKFYNINIAIDNNNKSWTYTADMLETRNTIETAQSLYRKIQKEFKI